ncbi:MAG: Ig-like domain-containing protein [Clostridia bacterium]|nr:Ig-like domain-containing protein [Clostridia bacterium]
MIITIIVLLILAGVTIAALTGSDSAPAKANEASQKNDIGTAKDDVVLTAVNAQNSAYETAYVENGVAAGSASTTVGTEVIKAVAQKYQTNNQIGKATIEVTGFGTVANVTGNATVSISTTDFIVEGTIYKDGGNLTWGEIEPNIPSIKIINAPSTLDIGKNITLQTEIKRVKDTPTISWSSNDLNEEIASINSDGKVTGIAEGDVTITAEIEVGSTKYSGTCQITIVAPPLAPQIGDFVNYNAGTWTEPEITALGSLYSVDATTDYTFGGFTKGSSRNTSVTPVNSDKNGWQIFDKEEIDGITYITKIISAGSPEKYNHPSSGNNRGFKSQYILGGGLRGEISTDDLTVRNWNMYRDTDWTIAETQTFAEPNVDVKLVTKAEMENIKYDQLKTTGATYYLPIAGGQNANLYRVANTGAIGGNNGINGIRPVITLKSGVTVKGTGTDHSTPAKAWELQ